MMHEKSTDMCPLCHGPIRFHTQDQLIGCRMSFELKRIADALEALIAEKLKSAAQGKS